jgi:hypothetical protein
MSTSGLSSPSVCPDSGASFSETDLQATFPFGIATDSIPVDPKTKTMSQSAVKAHINQLRAAGYIPETPVNPRTGAADMSEKSKRDTEFHNNVQTEYCFYEARYLHSMKKFLELATSLNPNDVPEAKRMLTISQSLNLKVNSILECTAALGDSRTSTVRNLKAKISSSNDTIASTSRQIAKQYSLLSKDNALIETQKHMIKYTKEKNDAIMNQISLFTILNAFAIGAIFAIVRQV